VHVPIPQWLALGTTSIVEEAVDERRFIMDFRMTHPWFGQLFRYSGVFEVEVEQPVHNQRTSSDGATTPPVPALHRQRPGTAGGAPPA
jgi:hypothetical protein